MAVKEPAPTPNNDGFGEAIDKKVDAAIGKAGEKYSTSIDEKVDGVLAATIERQVETLTTSKLDPFPLKIQIHPLIEIHPPDPGKDFNNKVPPELQALLDHPPALGGQATNALDGRTLPIVLGVLRDKAGATRAGIEVRLLDSSNTLVDRSRTDPSGVVLLRFQIPGMGSMAAGAPPTTGSVELADGTKLVDDTGSQVASIPISIPAGTQQIVVDLLVGKLPDIPTTTDPATGKTVAVPQLGDDPLSRLPSDFTPGLCEALKQVLGHQPDPILGKLADPSDFRSRRTPLIKRLTIPRIGKVASLEAGTTKLPRRYLVRLRQEWSFLGYTLGELAGVNGLDPGSVIQDVTKTLQRTADRTSRAIDEFTSIAQELVSNSLQQASSIDSLLHVATSSKTKVTAKGFGSLGVGGSASGGIGGGVAGGFLGPLGGLVGGLFGGGSAGIGIGGEIGTETGTSLFTSADTTSRTHTSLEVNSLLHAAKSLVNRGIRQATEALRELQSSASREIGQVSPLLSRVTNLLRWLLYENYAVCTHVEDVVEIRSIRITDPLPPGMPLFSDEDIVEYQRFFAPALLDQTLLPHFSLLRQAISERLAGGRPITTVHVAVDYSAVIFGADLKISIGDSELVLALSPGDTRASGTIYFPPVKASQLTTFDVSLTARPPVLAFGGLIADVVKAILDGGKVQVSKIRMWFDSSPASGADQTVNLGDTFSVTNSALVKSDTRALHAPTRLTDTTKDPLFRHVNRNHTYYFGVLAQAALTIPSLRDDAPQLANFNGNHPLWRLSIVGFEGDRVLVIMDVDPGDEDAKELIADAGSATLIQLAAPGSYAEALQGLLSLTDAAGKLHPALLPPVPAAMPPLALVDITGKTLGTPNGAQQALGRTLPGGTILPAGAVLPGGTTLPAGTILPAGETLPAGTVLTGGALLPNGSSLPPGSTLPIT